MLNLNRRQHNYSRH